MGYQEQEANVLIEVDPGTKAMPGRITLVQQLKVERDAILDRLVELNNAIKIFEKHPEIQEPMDAVAKVRGRY